jgi:hypothetical protein
MTLVNGVEVADAGNEFIPGTTFKTPDELAKGYTELKTLHDRQANELGTIRKEHESLKGQAESLATILKDSLTKNVGGNSIKETVKTDYAAELTNIEGQIQNLDPLSPDYQRILASLVAKSNRLTALDQHDKTLNAAGEMMKKELSERDIKIAQEAFHKDNPTFNTPEMQTKIREYIAKDRTGMSDPLSAFREIQRDEIAIEAKRLSDENAEYKRLIDLNKGKDETGKVVVKSQGAGQPPVKPQKATGKDLDAGMAAILAAQKT